MGLTALQHHGGELGAAAVDEYCGATTASGFGDPQAEFAALRSACGVYDLGYRAKLSITGEDRVRWLNGIVTNNIRDLAVGCGVYAFLLNPQGRILGDLYAYNRRESITVDTDCSQVEKLLATFDHYIIMDDVEVKNISEQVTALGISGPKSEEILRAAGFDPAHLSALEVQDASLSGLSCTILRTDEEQFPAYEIWVTASDVQQIWDRLVQAGAVRIGSEAVEMHRIVSGIPRYGVDIRERDLPQETEQVRALNFNKGCYIGQEIVERIRSRGAVHRKFTGFLAEDAVSLGSKVLSGDKEVGEITSAASVNFGNSDAHVALGYIRREVGSPGREVLIGSARAKVIQTPLTQDGLDRNQTSLEQRPA